MLAANGFAGDPYRAVFAYNHSDAYVRAVQEYAAVLAADPKGAARSEIARDEQRKALPEG